MMNVPAGVLVTSSFPIQGDGSEAAGAFVADLAEEIAKQVPVRVVAPGKADAQESWAPGVEVFRYATPEQPLSTLRLWHPGDAIQVLRVMRGGASATERAMQVGPVAHIVALWALPCGEWALRSAKRHGVGYSVWTLGSDIWSLGRIPVVRNRLRTILRRADKCWSDGVKLAQDTKEISGREVGFLPSVRRIDRVRTEPVRMEPPYRLLFLGRWHPNKGADLLFDALDHLSDEDWQRIAEIHVAGGGPMRPLVEQRVQRLVSAHRPVRLSGFLNRAEAERALSEADRLLLPSRIESIPVVFSDALAFGLPVVSMPVGDLPVLLKDGCGWLADKVTGTAFAQAIRSSLVPSPDVPDALPALRKQFQVETAASTFVGMWRSTP